ncbi:hypothetical protein [Solibacillus sp. FSL K6-1523]|uniref:hypothetical protein n=1 Tax=Solibacillus sp. FSL K6-1523 TaxID=2921471 RepID=UPI0030FABF57
MSVVKVESDYEITSDITIKVLWCLGDGDNGNIDETFGLEIEIDEWNVPKDEINGINCFSFGYEPWSQEVWEKFGIYIESVISKLPRTEQALADFIEWLLSFECIYTRGKDHLKDLDYIKELIKDI